MFTGILKRKIKTTVLLALTIFSIMALGLGQDAQAQLLFEDGFEAGNLDAWPYHHIEGGTQDASTVQARDGAYSAHFLCTNDYRTELEYRTGDQAGRFHFGKEYWVAYSFYIQQVPEKWGLIHQNHAVPNNEDWSTTAGPNGFSIKTENGNLVFTGSTNEALAYVKPSSGGADWGEEVYHQEPVKTGQWYDIVTHFKYSPDNTGFMEIWINGEQVVDYTGVTTYAVDTAGDLRATYNYLKLGLYLGGANGEVYYDNVRIGDASSSYAEVASGGPADNGPSAPANVIIVSH